MKHRRHIAKLNTYAKGASFMTVAIQERKKDSYKIFNDIASTYDLLNRLLSGGIDVYWRWKLIKNLPAKNELKIVDLATGTADMAMALAKQTKVEHVTGLDLSEQMLALGTKKVHRKGLTKKCTLKVGDGQNPDFPQNSVDVVTITYGIRNFSDPQRSLNNIYKILKPGGRLLIEEFGLPKNLFVRSVYLFYFRKLLPWVGNLLSKHKDAYTYLNETVEEFPYGQEFNHMLKNAGFATTQVNPMTFGISYLYVADKKEV